jgi:hypothetical protein
MLNSNIIFGELSEEKKIHGICQKLERLKGVFEDNLLTCEDKSFVARRQIF